MFKWEVLSDKMFCSCLYSNCHQGTWKPPKKQIIKQLKEKNNLVQNPKDTLVTYRKEVLQMVFVYWFTQRPQVPLSNEKGNY